MKRTVLFSAFALACTIWVVTVAAAVRSIRAFESTPGRAADAPARWPASATIARQPGTWTLVMLIHPHCSCSRASVSELAAADVALPLEFSGRVAGFRVVEIRAQVSGILLKREYLEGAVVDVGQVLFRIDPRTYEATLSRANAQAAQARAALIQAEENYKRQEGLAAQKVATQKSLEDAIAARDQARAAIQSTEADVQTAKLNLEFTVIKAPVKGPTSLVSPAEGTLIKAQDTLLTTITQLDPAYVNFTFTDSELRSLQEIDRSSEELFDPAHVKVELQFGDGATYPEPGTVDTRSRTSVHHGGSG
jgi:membrane fusion protein (multidrug efflux system)